MKTNWEWQVWPTCFISLHNRFAPRSRLLYIRKISILGEIQIQASMHSKAQILRRKKSLLKKKKAYCTSWKSKKKMKQKGQALIEAWFSR